MVFMVCCANRVRRISRRAETSTTLPLAAGGCVCKEDCQCKPRNLLRSQCDASSSCGDRMSIKNRMSIKRGSHAVWPVTFSTVTFSTGFRAWTQRGVRGWPGHDVRIGVCSCTGARNSRDQPYPAILLRLAHARSTVRRAVDSCVVRWPRESRLSLWPCRHDAIRRRWRDLDLASHVARWCDR